MPAGADRHVHVELGDPVAIVAAGRDRRARPGVAGRAHLPAGRGLGDAGVQRTVHPRGRADAHRARRLPDARPRGRPRAPGSRWPTREAAAGAVADLAARGAVAIKVSLNAEAGPTPSDAVLDGDLRRGREHDLPVTAHAARSRAGRARARAPGWASSRTRRGASGSTTRRSPPPRPACGGSRRSTSTASVATRPSCGCALDNLARFHRAGGEVVYGTDLGNGPIPSGVHVDELRWLRRGGPHDRGGARRRSCARRSRSVRRPTCSSWGRARSATSRPSTTSGSSSAAGVLVSQTRAEVCSAASLDVHDYVRPSFPVPQRESAPEPAAHARPTFGDRVARDGLRSPCRSWRANR